MSWRWRSGGCDFLVVYVYKTNVYSHRHSVAFEGMLLQFVKL